MFQSTPPHGGRLVIGGRDDRYRKSFNPRPRMGGDLKITLSSVSQDSFNPRPRMGGDSGGRTPERGGNGFNPRPRMGGDLRGGEKPFDEYGFNPRPRMGGDVPASEVIHLFNKFQSTPPHGGRRVRGTGLH